jgi:cell division protein FtsB
MKISFTVQSIHQTKRYLVIAVCALVVFPLAMHEILGQNGYLARRQRRTQIQTLTADVEKLKQENMQLTRRIQNLRSDPGTIEKLAREQLSLGRPGDLVVTLPPSK